MSSNNILKGVMSAIVLIFMIVAFIPLFQERYDLVIPKQFAEGDLLAPLFELLAERRFREAVSQLPGYDVSVMGTIILEE